MNLSETSSAEAAVMLSHALRTPLAGEFEGEEVGLYTLLEKLGDGGFGSVWRAEQSEPVQREVALKIIKLGMDTLEVMNRFEQERVALSLMDHPNIAKVLDAGATPEGRPFFVMELVRGVPITSYCIEKALPLERRLRLFKDVCSGVQHAHQKGIIHRDLKPSNILVAEIDGVPVPKIIDFGIAKAVSGEKLTELTLRTRAEQMIGTPLYMSPEQADGSADVDTRSDVYALGVLLYELLAGQPPFDAKTLVASGYEEMRRIIREQVPRPPSRRKDENGNKTSELRHSSFGFHQSKDLDLITLRALEKDRTRRYESATAFAEDIQRFLNHEPVTAHAPSPLYLMQRWVRRHRSAAAAIVVSFLAIVTGSSLAVWQAVLAKRAQQAAEQLSAEAARQSADADQATKVILGTLSGLMDYGSPPTIERKELVSQIMARVQAFQGGPLRKARMLSQLAISVSASDAVPLRVQALALAEPQLAPDDPELWTYRYKLAHARAMEGTQRKQALPEMLQALDWHRAHLGPHHPTPAHMSLECAYHCFLDSQHEQALELFSAGFAAPSNHLDAGPRRPPVFYRAYYAQTLDKVGRHDEALALGRENTRIALEELQNSPFYGAGRAFLVHARVLRANNLLDEAINAARQALDAFFDSSGPLDVSVNETVQFLYTLYDEKEDVEGNLGMLRDVVREFDSRLGPGHIATSRRVKTYSIALVSAGRSEEADEHNSEWLRRVRLPDGTLPAVAEEVLRGHGDMLRATQQWPRAEATLRELLEMMNRFRPNTARLWGDQSDLGNILLQQGRKAEAVLVLEEAMRELEKATPGYERNYLLPRAQKRLAEAKK